MNAVALNNFSSVHNTLSADEVRSRLAETEKMMDAYLARITRLQMILQLEEARLLQSQEEHNELQTLLTDSLLMDFE